MKLHQAGTELFREAAHFVEGNEAVVNVADRVFKALSHDRSGELLEFQGEIQPATIHHLVEPSAFEQQRVAKEVKHPLRHARVQALRLAHRELDVFLVARGVFAALVDVGTVDRKASYGFADTVAQSLQREVPGATVAR